VLDGGRALEAAQARDAHRAGLADPPEVIAEDVDDHDVFGPILGARQQLAGEGAVLRTVPAAWARALDRVARDGSRLVERKERLGGRGQQRTRPAGLRRRPEIEVCGEQGGIAGAQESIACPRVAIEGRLEPARQVRLVDVAALDVTAHDLDPLPVLGARQRGPEREPAVLGGARR
jgi:hypothetical protein